MRENPEVYIKDNSLQKRDVSNIINAYIKKMTWKLNETILDVGCGPGDVTTNILYPFLKDKIKQMIGVDKSAEMIEYAIKNNKCPMMTFKVLDIENIDDCTNHSDSFDKIFSFFCFHWVHKKIDAVFNVHSMLKRGGEVLIYSLLNNPFTELYRYLDDEWKCYIKDTSVMSYTTYSSDEMKSIFIEGGFRIINIESSETVFTFPDFPSFLNTYKAVDEIYNVLPPHLHDKYFTNVKNTICKVLKINICPDTGETDYAYLTITIHAIKD